MTVLCVKQTKNKNTNAAYCWLGPRGWKWSNMTWQNLPKAIRRGPVGGVDFGGWRGGVESVTVATIPNGPLSCQARR